MGLLEILGFGAETDTAPPHGEDTATMRRIITELEALPPARARFLAAFAYILGRVAHADSHFSEEESDKMVELVQALGHVPEAQALLVVELAKNEVQLFGGTDNFLVTRRFKEIATPDQCTELLDCVFAVSAADESVTTLEESQARQISKELGLTHDEFLAARADYLEHLEALKSFRRTRDGR